MCAISMIRADGRECVEWVCWHMAVKALQAKRNSWVRSLRCAREAHRGPGSGDAHVLVGSNGNARWCGEVAPCVRVCRGADRPGESNARHGLQSLHKEHLDCEENKGVSPRETPISAVG